MLYGDLKCTAHVRENPQTSFSCKWNYYYIYWYFCIKVNATPYQRLLNVYRLSQRRSLERTHVFTHSLHILMTQQQKHDSWITKNNSQQFLVMGSRWGILYTVIWVSACWHALLWDITASSNKAENPLNRLSVTITPIHSRSIFVELSRLCTHFKTNYTLSSDIVAEPAFAFGCLLTNTANSISHCFC